MIYIYAIKSKVSPFIYVGMTNNLERRFQEHNKGYSYSTKHCTPFEFHLGNANRTICENLGADPISY
ncbi:GIY-YIG nuclease family protein [Membranicola marinus]|uniref:GIY-YIG nuclease family protein n=1 Tax=Membranihabitans marinus TaxID=1227546 RepID=A0A953HRK5_9BACT|nr:GIY-YIG nuclease family protein [Membranihabitans marinus]